MSEDVERGFTSVGTLAGVANTTELQGGDGSVEESVIDGGASGCTFVENYAVLKISRLE
jgi:hypothetical protein